jgi:hypothetical protein
MKTTRFILTIALVSFVMMTFADTPPVPKSPEVKISLEKAMNSKTLYLEMTKQLNMEFLKIEHPGYYVTSLRCGYNVYVIYGKYKEWIAFFNMTKWRQCKNIRQNSPFSNE